MERITGSMLLAGLLAVVFCAAGCQIVHVEDPAGKPIAWADVSTSTSTGATSMFIAKTDFLGNATLSISQEPPGTREYLHVTKEGYTSYRAMRPAEGQVTVVLRKVHKFKSGGHKLRTPGMENLNTHTNRRTDAEKKK